MNNVSTRIRCHMARPAVSRLQKRDVTIPMMPPIAAAPKTAAALFSARGPFEAAFVRIGGGAGREFTQAGCPTSTEMLRAGAVEWMTLVRNTRYPS